MGGGERAAEETRTLNLITVFDKLPSQVFVCVLPAFGHMWSFFLLQPEDQAYHIITVVISNLNFVRGGFLTTFVEIPYCKYRNKHD